MKYSLYLFYLLSYFLVIFQISLVSGQQNQFDADGNIKIRGNIDITHQDDPTSLMIGRNAGINTDFSFQQFSTFVGVRAGLSNEMGNANSFFGNDCGSGNISGNSNCFFGFATGSFNTSGSANAFFGSFAGLQNTTGKSNSFFGSSAGSNNANGTRNTFLGTNANASSVLDSLDRAIAIGFEATVDCSRCAVIGGSGANAVRVGIGLDRPSDPLSLDNITGTKINLFDDGLGIYGFGIAPAELQIGTYDAGKHISLGHYSGGKTFVEWVKIDAGGLKMSSGAHITPGGVWKDASSRNLKENISDLSFDEALAALMELEPVKFHYKAENEEQYIGFIAEDVPELVATNDRKSLSPMDLVGVLTKTVQQQQMEITKLRVQVAEIESIKKEIDNLKKSIAGKFSKKRKSSKKKNM